jgi:ABC-type antimicrobial peptide transport system ATPase subunit
LELRDEVEEYIPTRFPTQNKNLGFLKHFNDMVSVLGNGQIISAGLHDVSGQALMEDKQKLTSIC